MATPWTQQSQAPSQVKPRVPSTSSKNDDKGCQLPVGGECKDGDEEEEDELPEKGDIVARVLPGSTMHNPLVSVGKVYKVDPLQRLVYISVFQRVDQAKQLYRSELLGTRDKVPASEVAHPLHWTRGTVRIEDTAERHTPTQRTICIVF